MTTTQEQREDPPTFEKVWAMLQEIGRKQEETSRRMEEKAKEADRQMQEMAKEIERLRKEWEQERQEKAKEEADRSWEEVDQSWEETKQQIRDLSLQFPSLVNWNEPSPEEQFADLLRADRESDMMFAGQHYDAVTYHSRWIHKGIWHQFDIILNNYVSVVIIELSDKACLADVDELLAKKLPYFRASSPAYQSHAVYLAIGSMSFDDRVLSKARELGIGILRQKGDTIEADTDHVRAY